MNKILAIDDDIGILKLIQRAFLGQDVTVTIIDNPDELSSVDITSFELILLDIMMPDMDGFELCEKIRKKVDCPIIFLSALEEEQSILTGLGIGGDDYLTKPFSISELRARVHAHLRRENRTKEHSIFRGAIRIDLSGARVFVKDQKVELTKSEFMILKLLAMHPGRTYSREQIFIDTYGYDRDSNESVITEHVKNIRRKFDNFDINPFVTVWGIGYKWEE
ncbi:response regulator transcription factor [Sporosarcina sp. BP05]|uniref:response regulator transcription factor n=1 Tax=Sporosarcina sp. BP05 TaxID=2758726 RepID=UPI0016456684|nr:response regulator transcription factor [Sporosarcina sp. BP05]